LTLRLGNLESPWLICGSDQGPVIAARGQTRVLGVNRSIRHETDWRRRCGYEAPLGNDDATGACIVFNIKRKQLSPHQVEKLVRQTAEADGYDTEIIIEQEPGSSGTELTKHYHRNVFPGFRVRIVPATTKKMAAGQPTMGRFSRSRSAHLVVADCPGTRSEHRPAICPTFAPATAPRSCYVLGANFDMLCAVHPSFAL